MMHPSELEQCESCGQRMPFMGTIPFRRGKPRRVCALCLAQCLQAGTGWKMVNQVMQYIQTSLKAQEVSDLYRGVAAAVRGEVDASNE